MTKCIVCEVRPSRNGDGTCHNCESKIDRERRLRKPEKAFRYVVYKDYVCGLYRSGNGTYKPTYKPRPVGIKVSRLPKSITIDLTKYCAGFTKAQVKKLKAAVLQAHVV